MFEDFEIDCEALARWLSARHPACSDVKISDLRKSSGGFSNITVMGDLAWRRAGKPEKTGVVIRVQPNRAALFPDCDITVQYHCMEKLAGSDVPVPRLLGIELDATILGAPFYLMERIDGRVPPENPPYHVAGWLRDLSRDQQRSHWLAGLDAIALINRVDWKNRGFEFLLPSSGDTPLERTLAYYLKCLRWSEAQSRKYPHLHAAYAWLSKHKPRDEPVALVWGDAKLGNCIYCDGKLAGVLDWENVRLGNPVDDLSWWIMLDSSLCKGYDLPRLEGFPSCEESVAHWERASGFSARDLPYYEVLSAW